MDSIFNELIEKWNGPVPSTTLVLFIAAVVPGVIIVFVRSQFVKGSILPYPAGFLSYLTVSTVYWLVLLLLISPLVMLILDYARIHYLIAPFNEFKEVIFVIIVPILVGFVAGWVATKGYVYKILYLLKLNPFHPTPTAWEWCFSETVEQFVLITLKNGVQFGGMLDSDSFASSDIENQDIYISEVYEIDNQNNWIPQGRGVFLSSGEISSVEFIPIEEEERSNVKNTPTSGKRVRTNSQEHKPTGIQTET